MKKKKTKPKTRATLWEELNKAAISCLCFREDLLVTCAFVRPLLTYSYWQFSTSWKSIIFSLVCIFSKKSAVESMLCFFFP